VLDKRFLMYGIPRSGSTSMVSILQHHPDIRKMDYEPFIDWRLSKCDVSLNEKLNELRFLDGFKIHINQIGPKFIKEALKKRKKVIFMDRRNIFKCALSLDRAYQSGIWQRTNIETKHDFPVNFGNLKKTIKNLYEQKSQALKLLKKEKIDYYHFFYEDFYLVSEEEKIRQLSEIFEFLGHRPVINQRMLKVLRTNRLNDERTYLQIPGIYKIEKKLGSNENGWLFNGGLQL